MSEHPCLPAYIIAAKRTALGRIGGLHRDRRLDDLAAPLISALISEVKIPQDSIQQLVLGNASESGNPARVIALAAGLPEETPAYTIDRQCSSGLDAIVIAARGVSGGEYDAVIAGGAESLSTAPWRVSKPKKPHQLPHFIRVEPCTADASEEPQLFEASESLARYLSISRAAQDAYALKSHMRAQVARDERRFRGEVLPLRGNASEARDESAIEPSLKDLEDLPAFVMPDGTTTPGNTSAMHDGAALVLIVSGRLWKDLGKPPAMCVAASAATGVPPDREAFAPIVATKKLLQQMNGFDRCDVAVVELSESSAAQAMALERDLAFEEAVINPDGGAIVRGHPLGAAGAVLVTRLFTTLVRHRREGQPKFGIATLGTIGGMGLATLFEAQ